MLNEVKEQGWDEANVERMMKIMVDEYMGKCEKPDRNNIN